MTARLSLLLGILALAALVHAGLAAPSVALHGWLIAFVFWSGISIGALVLLLIHALTGGRWVGGLAPGLAPTAAALPVLFLLVVPVVLGVQLLYPWAEAPSGVSPDVARLYLNPTAFLLRTAVALAGWSLLSLLVARVSGPRLPLVAAVGLVFHALAISVIAVDWILSLEPGFTSTVFAAGIGLGQLLAALAWAALFLGDRVGRGTASDVAGLLLATLLGVFYLDYMQYVVDWYGDLPSDVTWYQHRLSDGWQWVILASLLVGVLLPAAALLFGSVRAWPRAIRAIGAAILAGRLLHLAWLIGPADGPGTLLTGALATAAIGGLGTGLARSRFRHKEMAHGI